MKTDRNIMNCLAVNSTLLRELTPQESINLKKSILEIYKDVSMLCQQYGLIAMLAGGSALGAVRHKGFIPWDDDFDLLMYRSDYENLILLLEQGALGDKYDFTYPNKYKDSKNLFLKIYLKGTEYVEIADCESPFPKGVYIDIFPLDNVSAYRIARLIKGFIADIIAFWSVSVLYYQYQNELFRNYMSGNKKAFRRYKFRLFIGKIGHLLGKHGKWAYHYDKLVSSKKNNGYLGIPTGRKHYKGEILRASVYLPPSKAMFENIEVFVPNDVDAYLKNLYGNYMELPPIEKRERHFVVSVKL
ncbi:MAG: LicD family protein [Bacteroides sp.]|nr:LicD family protein [Bacteroides sp.]